MTNIIKFSALCFSIIFFAGCRTQVQPAIVPAVEVPVVKETKLGIIGAVEPVYFLPMKSPFEARIDTGAENSAIDVTSLKTFERDGEKWVSFVLTNDETGETQRFEKEIVRQATIKRSHKDEKRHVVTMEVRLGNEIISANFSLANREKFEYQALIGRNILTGRAIVDTSVSHTLN